MSQSNFGDEKTATGLHAALIEELLRRSSPTNVLDLGCGEASWLKRLQKAGFGENVGIDWKAEEFRSNDLIVLRGNIESDDLGLGDAKFGLITMIEVIEHMMNPGKLLNQAQRHLAPQGLVLITTPNIHSLIQRLKFLVKGRFTHFDAGSDSTHYQPLLLEAWKRLLPFYGFAIVDCWTYPKANRLDGINQSWRYLAAVLQLFLRNDLPGEILCILLKKATITSTP